MTSIISILVHPSSFALMTSYCKRSIPDYKLCYVEDVDHGDCGIPFIDVFVYVQNETDDTLVKRNDGFRENFPEEFYQDASTHKSGGPI